MFCITAGKGFHITFENGWTVSVQWGPGNYCDHHRTPFGTMTREGWHSVTAEVGIWSETPNGDTEIYAWQTPEEVAEKIADVVARQPVKAQQEERLP